MARTTGTLPCKQWTHPKYQVLLYQTLLGPYRYKVWKRPHRLLLRLKNKKKDTSLLFT